MASEGKSDHYHKEAPESKDGDVARVQMDFNVRWRRVYFCG